MKAVIAALTLACSLLSVVPVMAIEPEYKVQVVYAGDQSASMRFSRKPSWMSAQQYFLTEYFKNFRSRCQELHVDYLGWGTKTLPPVRAILRTNADGQEFSDVLFQLTYQNEGVTVQHEAFLQTRLLLNQGQYDKRVVIFVSDANQANSPDDVQLWKLIPPEVEFIGISLGDITVANYFKWHIVPGTVNGKHYHAYTSSEFETILYDVFDGLGYDHCRAS